MPAASEPAGLPDLPLRIRPFGVRFAAYLAGGLLIVVALVMWFALSPEIREKFTFFQLATIFALAGGAATCGYALTRSRIDAREDGLTVVNGFKRRELEWSQVLAVTLKPGSPWAVLDLSDGTSVSAMAIQGSDGPRAMRYVRTVRSLAEAHSRTPRND